MHLRRSFALLLLIYVAATSGRASAADISTTELKDGDVAITITGDLVIDDDKKFKKIALVVDSAFVFLDSKGGSTIAALKIGETIRLKGYATYVDGDMTCVSACALIWLAGSPRFLGTDGRVGFHATYIEKEGRQEESGGGNALVGRYLTLLNLNENAVFFATSAPPDSLNWLDADNYRSIGIELTSIDTSNSVPIDKPPVVRTVSPPPTVEASKNQVSKWKDVGGWSVNVDHTIGSSCFAIATTGTSALRIGFDVSDDFSSYFLIADENWKSLIVDKQYQIELTFGSNSPWTAKATGVKIGSIVALRIYFSNNEFWNEFSEAKSLEIGYKSSSLIDVALYNNDKILDELVKCQKAQFEAGRKFDPFSE